MPKPFIIVVEDNFLIAEATSRFLADAGYRVAMSQSAEAALVLARSDHPDLALVDLSLKVGMTGGEAAEQLRALGCAVIICTAYAEPAINDHLEQIRPAAVLSKPIGEDDIVAAVKAALSTRH